MTNVIKFERKQKAEPVEQPEYILCKKLTDAEIKAIASHVTETMLAEIDARIKAGKKLHDE